MELEKNRRKTMKNFHNRGLKGILGLGWAGGGELEGEKIRLSMVSPDLKIGKCPYF